MSAKIALILAAAAFVVVFRVHAGDNDPSQVASAAPLSAARASAIESDKAAVVKRPASKLAAVVALPGLAREPKAKVEARKRREAAERRARAHRRKLAAARKRAAAKRAAAAAAAAAARKRAAPAPTATPVPTPVYTPPTYV